ncbi:MAG: purine-nucleoside phosphorylase [Andreesenia angusta]|nr:purine-nucleoside phosphorylase [Andreesenia angusta]
MNEIKRIEKAKLFIEEQIKSNAKLAIILGSGLGDFAKNLEDREEIDYASIPGFPVSTVEGHEGKLIFSEIDGVEILIMSGRFHFYEGYDIKDVVFPIRVIKALGIESLIITNAAGGVNQSYNPGDFMIIKDHINFGFNNPLIGPNDESLGVRFPDMTYTYDREYIDIAKSSAENLNIDIREGVYFYNLGPTYETPAEVKMISTLGGDSVGMSTVPEVIVARHSGIRVLGISCITNMAAGILEQPLNHQEVVETGERVKESFELFIKDIISKLG